MEWSKDDCLMLIQEYQKYKLLWDAKDPFHYSKTKKHDAWCSLGKLFNTDHEEVRKKMASLSGSFRREKAKGKKSMGTGKGAMEVYISNWFAFKSMLFLADKDQPRPTLNTESGGYDSDLDKTLEVFDNSRDSEKDNEELVNCSDENILHDNLLQANAISEAIIEPNLTQDKSEFVVPSSPKPVKPKTKRLKKSLIEEDPRIQEAFDFIKAPIQNPSPSLVYAQYIANKLDTYQGQTRALVEHAIHNVFFEADMGKFNHYSSTQNNPPNSSYYSQQSYVPHYSMPRYPTDLVADIQTTPASPYINVTSPGSVSSVTDSSTTPQASYSNLQELFNDFSN